MERDQERRTARTDAPRARFDVFLTGDRNLQFQQLLPAAGVAVVLLQAKSTKLADTLPLMAEVLARLALLLPGTITMIPANPNR